MATNAIFMGWNRPNTGAEQKANEHFGEIVGWFGKLASEGKIQGFQPVFLAPHGGDMNGFFLITGSPAQLDALRRDEAYLDHVTRGGINMVNFGVCDAVTGDEIPNEMARWQKYI